MRATGLRAVHRAMAAMTLHSGTPSGARGQRCVRSAASAAAAPATENAPKPIYLKDYAKPQYAFAKVDLDFALGEASTAVKSTIRVEPQSANAGDLFLHGDESVELVQIMVDGGAFTSYKRSSKGITLSGLPQSAFELVIETRIKPQENTALEGLYKSGKNFCTQCEAEGFRRITFYQDMGVQTTTPPLPPPPKI